jgi:thiol-disulfide isomerase/thioredoxin
MRGVWLSLLCTLAVVAVCQETSEIPDGDSAHKVSVEIDTKDGAPQPYFATFDSTNVAYHWETNMIDDTVLKQQLQIIDANDLSKEQLEALLEKAKKDPEVVDTGLIQDEVINPKDIFQQSQLFEEAGPHNIAMFLQRNKAFVMFLLCDCARDELVARAVPRLEQLIKDAHYDDLYSFMYLYPPATAGFQLHMVFDMTMVDIPALIIDNVPVGANMEKYRYDKLLASHPDSKTPQLPSDLFNFIQQFQHRTLRMLIRSAPVPEDHNNHQLGTVKEVVASTFEEVVLNSDKNVFLLVYSPRCGGSIAVQPVFQEIAKELEYDSDILIARMDGTQNDIPVRGVPLTHYPSAFLFPRGAAYKEDGQLNFINWDDYNGSKSPHNANVPVGFSFIRVL